MLPADRIENVKHAQLQRNTEMVNRRKDSVTVLTVTVGNAAPLALKDKK